MATQVILSAQETFECPPEVKVKEAESCEPVLKATHANLRVCDSPEPPASKIVQVSVFDASNGNQAKVYLKTANTIGELKQKYLQMRPELKTVGKVKLAYNGKPASKTSTLADLGVKTGAMFITYHRCTGG